MACGENPKRVYGTKGAAPASRMGNVAAYREAWIAAADYRDEMEEDDNGNGDAPKRDLQLESSTPVMGSDEPSGRRPAAGSPHRVWHARRSHELALGLVCRDLLRQPGKLVYTSPTPRRHGALWRWIVRRSDAVIAVTERAASYLDWYTAVVPHRVDVDAFLPAENRQEAWREGGLPGRYGIGIFGRIRHGKGTDLFVDTMCEVLPRHPEFTAVVAGF